MKTVTIIKGKQYYSVGQMFNMFKEHLQGETPFTTFYKKFAKWKADNGVKPDHVEGKKEYYSKVKAGRFINEFEYITHYSTRK